MEAAVKLAPGVALGPFRLREKLALGGMAEIWSAESEGGTVALKILQPMFSKDQSFRAMFQDEVDIATKLTHANIVQVHGAHEIDGFVFQSMELLEGRDLRRVLSALARAGRWFPVRFALYVGLHVARALAYAHARRGENGRPLEIVHRDVSPHNVMLATDGRVKVLDFGIARAAERLARTRPGVVKGKIPYMAPEQALAVGVTPQTDIFATGVVLWEMLAMRRLFKGESDPDLLQQVVRAEIPPLVEQNEKVPADVAVLIHRMLAQRAANRPASMQDVENDLGRMLARHFGEVSQAQLAEWAEPYLEEKKRAPTMVLPVPGADEPAGDPTEPTPGVGVITEPTVPPDEEDLTAEAQGAFEEAMSSWESPPDPVSGADDTLAMPSDHAEDRAEEAEAEEEEEGEEAEPPANASGPTVAMESVSPTRLLPAQEAKTPSNPSNPSNPNNPSGPSDAGDGATARFRMPTRSEIIRAVESVPTIPVRADLSLLSAIEQRVEVESAPVEAPPSVPIERAPSPADPDRQAERADSTDPAPTITMAPPGDVPAEESTEQRGSVLPLIALGLALLVVIALALLVLAD